MDYNIIPTAKFKKEAKRLYKKYTSLKTELETLNSLLLKNPEAGTSLGNNTFKIRISIKSKGAGKSSGARVITYVIHDLNKLYLLTIYDKADFDIIDEKILRKIIKNITNK